MANEDSWSTSSRLLTYSLHNTIRTHIKSGSCFLAPSKFPERLPLCPPPPTGIDRGGWGGEKGGVSQVRTQNTQNTHNTTQLECNPWQKIPVTCIKTLVVSLKTPLARISRKLEYSFDYYLTRYNIRQIDTAFTGEDRANLICRHDIIMASKRTRGKIN
jgi:hypothetical protein